MTVDVVVDPEFRDRSDLQDLVREAATFLASRDREQDSSARAMWRVSKGPEGQPRIGLELRDREYAVAQTFSPNQLLPADIRVLRLLSIWNDVMRERTWRGVKRVNELLNQPSEDEDAQPERGSDSEPPPRSDPNRPAT
jgi:hypothetical protein